MASCSNSIIMQSQLAGMGDNDYFKRGSIAGEVDKVETKHFRRVTSVYY